MRQGTSVAPHLLRCIGSGLQGLKNELGATCGTRLKVLFACRGNDAPEVAKWLGRLIQKIRLVRLVRRLRQCLSYRNAASFVLGPVTITRQPITLRSSCASARRW